VALSSEEDPLDRTIAQLETLPLGATMSLKSVTPSSRLRIAAAG
jgi:hypothetical protein